MSDTGASLQQPVVARGPGSFHTQLVCYFGNFLFLFVFVFDEQPAYYLGNFVFVFLFVLLLDEQSVCYLGNFVFVFVFVFAELSAYYYLESFVFGTHLLYLLEAKVLGGHLSFSPEHQFYVTI